VNFRIDRRPVICPVMIATRPVIKPVYPLDMTRASHVAWITHNGIGIRARDRFLEYRKDGESRDPRRAEPRAEIGSFAPLDCGFCLSSLSCGPRIGDVALMQKLV
jgi:hypothetical protein